MKRFVLCFPLLLVPAFADIVPTNFTSGASVLVSYQADTFQFLGSTGSINLNTASPVTVNVNSAQLNIGNSGSFSGSESLTVGYNLTVGGVTHSVSQMATWSVTPALDTFLTFQASSPVLFDLGPNGEYAVTINAFSISSGIVGSHPVASTSATFDPVPEPTSVALLGAVVAMTAMRIRKCSQTPARRSGSC